MLVYPFQTLFPLNVNSILKVSGLWGPDEAPCAEISDDLRMHCPNSVAFSKWKVTSCGDKLRRSEEKELKRNNECVHLASQDSNWWGMWNKFSTIYFKHCILWINDRLISKAWSGCSERAMGRIQDRNQEQINWSRCVQSSAGIRSCRRTGEPQGQAYYSQVHQTGNERCSVPHKFLYWLFLGDSIVWTTQRLLWYWFFNVKVLLESMLRFQLVARFCYMPV